MTLTPADLLRLIEACDKHRVTKFRAGEVEVTFSGYRDPTPPVSQTEELARLIQNDKDWMEQDLPAPVFQPEVE